MLTPRPNWPFSPNRFPFFYGWWIVGVATLGVWMSIPGQTAGVSVFTDSLIEATSLSRAEVSFAYLLGTIFSGFTLPFAGKAIDKLGARPVAVMASAGLALVLILMSQIDAFGAAIGSMFAALGLGFYALRFSGQGMLTLVSRTMMARWFDKRRGLATGIHSVFAAFWFGAAPRILDIPVEAFGWRGAWQMMSLIIAGGMMTTALLFFRDSPEACGLLPDGQEQEANAEPAIVEGYTTKEAMSTLAFWAIAFVVSTQALIITAISFHIVDIGAAAGLSRHEALELFVPMTIVSTITALVAGAASDRLPLRIFVVTMVLAQGLGIWAATDINANYLPLALGLGVSGGLFGTLLSIAYANLFGRKHLGSINGIQMMCVVIGSALGPMLFAESKELFESYQPGIFASLGLPVIGLLLSLLYKSPPPPGAPEEPAPRSF